MNLNLQSLYNKNKYLKKINQKFNTTSRNNTQKKKVKKEVKLEKDIVLNPDSGTIVQHGMFTKKLRITARGAEIQADQLCAGNDSQQGYGTFETDHQTGAFGRRGNVEQIRRICDSLCHDVETY